MTVLKETTLCLCIHQLIVVPVTHLSNYWTYCIKQRTVSVPVPCAGISTMLLLRLYLLYYHMDPGSPVFLSQKGMRTVSISKGRLHGQSPRLIAALHDVTAVV